MKLTEKSIKELETAKYVVSFEREPLVGDAFSIGDVTFEARKREYKIVVL